MKRLFVAILGGAVLCSAPYLAIAFKKSDLAPLPNFDKRRDHLPDKPELPPGQAVAAAALEERVPGVNVSVDKLLKGPGFVTSAQGFLTGPQGQGKGVQNAAPQNGPHGPLRAFHNQHSALFGFGTEVLDAAILRRDYVTPHNG